MAWSRDNPWVFANDYIEAVVQDVSDLGCDDPYEGPLPRIELEGTNHRETLTGSGASSRLRAVLLELRDAVSPGSTVYAPEAITPFAERLRHLFPNYVGSEYLPTAPAKARYSDVNHQDVTRLSYRDASFDAYVFCEILEHVPSVSEALRAAARVLRPSGLLVATFPFAYMDDVAIEKARRLPDGRIEHPMPPEFHGNLVGDRSLVFSVPGWQIVHQTLASGFTDCEVVFHSSRRYGITGAEIAGVFVMRATR